jgi:hypothetical protein
MTYDSLTPEQQARADALHAAAAALGSPKEPFDDDIVRAAFWITTGKHGAILDFFEGTPGTETHLDGGDVGLDGTTEPAPAEARVGVTVTRTAHHPSWDERYGQDTPPRQGAGLEAIEALRSSVASAGANVAEALRRGPIDGGGRITGLATDPTATPVAQLVTAADLHPSNGQRADPTLRAVTDQ